MGGSATRSNSRVHASCQGRWGQAQGDPSGGGRDPDRDVDQLARAVAVVAFASFGAAVRVGRGADEVERDDREHQPGGVGDEPPGGYLEWLRGCPGRA